MIKTITCHELKEKMENGENIVLVDCREKEEWDHGHIPGAVFMPLSQFSEHAQDLNKGATIIMQCRSGARSMKACHFLDNEGYTDISNLEGGIMAWGSHGLPITEPEGNE